MLSSALLVASRAAHLIGCAVLLGTLVLRITLPKPAHQAAAASLRRLVLGAGIGAGASGIALLVAQALDMADLPVGQAVWLVAGWTVFGRAALLRLLLIFATVLGSGRPRAAALAAVLAAVSLAATGHGAAAGETGLMLALVAHVLGAFAWLGALPGLLLVLRDTAPANRRAVLRRFSGLGAVGVALLLAGAWGQAGLVGAWPALLGTPYGRVVAVKMGLLGMLLALAARNLVDAFGHGALPAGLSRRIWAEACLGGAALAGAALVVQYAPGAHLQPVWPFAWRPSFAVLDDPDLRSELRRAAAALLGGVALAAVAIVLRPVRLALLALSAAAALWAAPSFRLLAVPATPTSYFRSPTGLAAESVVRGAALYPVWCGGCHGAGGRGDGPLAAGLAVPPADLGAPHLWDHADGELFGWLHDGMRDGQDRIVMPGFADRLGDDDCWALIDFIRARNAGLRVPAESAAPGRASHGAVLESVERQIVNLGLRARTRSGESHAHHP